MEADRLLSSWKEIATHFGVSPRTAQRWERAEGLPVRRHKHEVLSSVFAYASELDAWWHGRPDIQSTPPHGRAPARSIAVLPFVNLNRDEKGEILSDGLTEELINALAQVEGLHVVARTSAFHFKGRDGDIREVGAILGVQTVLEGSLRRSDARLRVHAQLINVADGYHTWSRRFDRDVKDLFDLEEELARSIVDALQVKLDHQRITGPDAMDPLAFELCLEGRYHSNRRTRAGFLKAVECFKQAIARDSSMGRAWAGLATCHAFLGQLAGIAAEESLPRAKAAALKALTIDESLPDARCAIGFVAAVLEYDWPTATGHFRRALECSPDHADSHLWFAGHVLAPMGFLKEAAYHADRACQLDPLSPPALAGLGGSRLMSRLPDEAIAACGQALELDPGYPFALRFLGEAYVIEDRIQDALEAFSIIEAPVIADGFRAFCLARSGRQSDARRLLREIELRQGPSMALQAAAAHLGLGDMDSAFTSLGKACQERSMGVHWLSVEPFWDPLRTDSRFAGLLARLNLVS